MLNAENEARVFVNVGGVKIEISRLGEIANSMAQRIKRGYNSHFQTALVHPEGVSGQGETMVEAYRGDGSDVTIVFQAKAPDSIVEDLSQKGKRV